MRSAMEPFRLVAEEVAEARARAAVLGASAAAEVVERAVRGDPLADAEAAARLLTPAGDTEDLLAVARTRRPAGPRLEAFSPLYRTNECDAECVMRGMRRTNDDLVRETADDATADAQLAILHRRGLRAVALLTGEYHHGAHRRRMIARTAETLRAALVRGFTHVLVNIGALDAPEYETLLAGVPRRPDGRVAPRVTMC